MSKLTVQEKLQKVNDWIKKQKLDLEELKEDSMLVTYWQDGEDEAGAGVGNAWFESGVRYSKLSKQNDGKIYILPCNKNGVITDVDLSKYDCLEDMKIADIKSIFNDDAIWEHTIIQN